MSRPIDTISDELILEKVKLVSQQHVSLRELNGLTCDWRVAVNEAAQNLILTLKSFVYAAPKERITIYRQWPADWWEAFKERWFPPWLRNRFPVRYECVDINETKFGPVCPHTIVFGSPAREDGLRMHVDFLRGNTGGEGDDS